MADKDASTLTTKPSAKAAEQEPAKSTGVNQTDAPGVKTGFDAGAAGGESAEIRRAREIVARADQELEAAGVRTDSKGRLPQVLKSNLDVRRGNSIYRIPAGTVVTDAELSDEEFDHALAMGIVGEATLSDIRADQQRKQQAKSDEEAKVARRDAVGVSPKGASKGPPAGATLVSDLTADAAAQAAQRATVQAAVAGAGRGPAPAPVAGTK